MKTNRQIFQIPMVALQSCGGILIRVFILIATLLASHAAYTATGDKGIGGTGIHGDIGGTGIQTHNKGIGGAGKTSDKGIGGTGKQFAEGSGIGGTGIIGTISAIPDSNSIIVNGVRVTLGATTALTINNKRASANKLRIGQRVTLYTSMVGKNLVASKININYDLIAVIQFTSHLRNSFLAAGQTVLLHESIKQEIRNAQPGRTVYVSGLRKNNGSIVATAVSFSDESNKHGSYKIQVSGKLNKIGRNRFYLNGLSITVKPGQYNNLDNRMVTVIGQQTKKGFQLQRISKHSNIPFGGIYKRLLLEGYLSSVNSDKLGLNGTSILLNNKTSILGAPKTRLVTDTRVYISVYLDSSDRMTADTVRFSSDIFDRREVISPLRKERKTKKVDSSDDAFRSKEHKQNNDDGDNQNDDKDSAGNDDGKNDDASSEKAEPPEAPEAPEDPET